MVPSDLTREEIAFLIHHGFQQDEIYDARLHRVAVWQAKAKEMGFVLVLGSPCKKAGHRIRTRANHCVQCDTSKIAYVTRHNLPGYVYIAATVNGALFKIGSAIDIEQRERNLRNHCYGGFADWTIVATAKVENRGQTEQNALRGLKDFFLERPYNKDGKEQIAREMMRAPLSKVLMSFSASIRDDKPTELWNHSNLALFDFPIK